MNIPDLRVLFQLASKMDSFIDDEESCCYNERNKLTEKEIVKYLLAKFQKEFIKSSWSMVRNKD